jgi:acetolactate synthase-1/2/3 large subunit
LAISGSVGDVVRTWMPRVEASIGRSGSTHHRAEGDSAVRDIQNLPTTGIWPQRTVSDIWRITDGKAIVVTDVGQHQMWKRVLKHETPRSLITSGGLGTIG